MNLKWSTSLVKNLLEKLLPQWGKQNIHMCINISSLFILFFSTLFPASNSAVLASGSQGTGSMRIGCAGCGVRVGQAGQLLTVMTIQNQRTISQGGVNSIFSHLKMIVSMLAFFCQKLTFFY
jgi:hypothetical protein